MKRTPLRSRPVADCPTCATRGLTLCGHGAFTRPQLQRRQEQRRRTALPKRNAERAARLWAEQYGSEERVLWTQRQPCIVPGCWAAPCEVSHVRSRAAGGTADDTVSQCPAHHREMHALGLRTWAGKYGLDLEALAREFAAAWEARTDERART